MMTAATTLSRSDLVEKMKGRRGSFFVTIVADTDPRLLKTGNPFAGVRKISRVNGLLNWIYENAVNNQRVRENQPLDSTGEVEHFDAKPRKWGERIRRDDGTVTPLVEHKDRHYLELKVQKSLGHEYRDSTGAVLDPAQVAKFIPNRKEGERQEVDSPVILRDYAIENIVQITIDGIVYEVTD
jgi:hypothetical protein